MSKILQVFYALFSAILLSLAIQNEFLPWGSPFLGLFALVPLYIAFSRAKTARESGFLFSLTVSVTHLLSSFWLSNFKDFALFTIGATTIWYTISCFFLGQLFYGVFFIPPSKKLIIDSGKNPWHIPRRVFLFVSLYILFEWQKSTGFLAYPWGTLYMASYKWQIFSQIAAITGSLGISWLFAFFSSIFAEGLILLNKVPLVKTMHSSFYALAASLFLLFMLSMVYGTIIFTGKKEVIDYFDVILVQQNTDSWENDFQGDKKGILISQALSEKNLGQMNTKADLIVWSETNINSLYLPDYYERLEHYPPERPLLPFIREKQVPFAIGGVVRLPQTKNQIKREQEGFSVEEINFGNAILIFDSDAKLDGYSAKSQLVPFAEAIPYADSLWMQKLMQKVAGFSSGWTAGSEIRLFPLALKSGNTVRIANLVCFEDAFTDLCRKMNNLGADVFVNLTNDSWSKTNSAEIQHFVVASFRALEFRKPLIRSTNSGYTVVVDAYGNRIADLPLFVSDALSVSVPLYKNQLTTYARFGNWVPLCSALFVLFHCLLFLKNKIHAKVKSKENLKGKKDIERTLAKEDSNENS